MARYKSLPLTIRYIYQVVNRKTQEPLFEGTEVQCKGFLSAIAGFWTHDISRRETVDEDEYLRITKKGEVQDRGIEILYKIQDIKIIQSRR